MAAVDPAKFVTPRQPEMHYSVFHTISGPTKSFSAANTPASLPLTVLFSVFLHPCFCPNVVLSLSSSVPVRFFCLLYLFFLFSCACSVFHRPCFCLLTNHSFSSFVYVRFFLPILSAVLVTAFLYVSCFPVSLLFCTVFVRLPNSLFFSFVFSFCLLILSSFCVTAFLPVVSLYLFNLSPT